MTTDLLDFNDEDPRMMDRNTLPRPTNHTTYRWIDRQDIIFLDLLLTDVLINGKLVSDLLTLEDIRRIRDFRFGTDGSGQNGGFTIPYIIQISQT